MERECRRSHSGGHRSNGSVSLVGRYYMTTSLFLSPLPFAYGLPHFFNVLTSNMMMTTMMMNTLEECSKLFGGLDILSIDAVVDENGKHTILEVLALS